MTETLIEPGIGESPIGGAAAEHDEMLCEGVMRALFHADFVGLYAVNVAVDKGVARLVGHVPTYYLKQLAQSAAASVNGINYIENQIRVRQYPR